MPNLLLKIRRPETPAYARLKRVVVTLLRVRLPIPRSSKPLLRAMYTFHWAVARAYRRFCVLLYAEPLFRGRCDHVAERLFLCVLPDTQAPHPFEICDDLHIISTH